MGSIPLNPYRMADVTLGHDSYKPTECTYKELFGDLLADIMEDDSDNEEAILVGLTQALEEALVYHVNVAKKLERIRQRVLNSSPVSNVREQ